ncbi:MAG: hypothetical protein K0U98_13910 [Deltaproteobacteria bacterium]|nr:hypothetical protein [Deltaproteobacteria bacterium]
MPNIPKSRLPLILAFVLGWGASLILGPSAPENIGANQAWADLPNENLIREMEGDLTLVSDRRNMTVSSHTGSPYLIVSLAESENTEVDQVEGRAQFSATERNLIFGLVPVMNCQGSRCNPCRDSICIAPRRPPVAPFGPTKLLNFPQEPSPRR